jgi:hypothetical protein
MDVGYNSVYWIQLIQASYCEHGNETFGSLRMYGIYFPAEQLPAFREHPTAHNG